MLDNVIDINYYSVPQARTSNMRHRPVGLGLMGFQDALYKLRLAYGSDAAVTFADRSMEAIELLRHRGVERTRRGTRQLRQLRRFAVEPGHHAHRLTETAASPSAARLSYLDCQLRTTMDWDSRCRTKVKDRRHAQLQRHGDRTNRDDRQHHRGVAIDRADVSEPVRQIEPVRRVHRGQPLHGSRPESDMGLWDEVMVNDLKYYDGSLYRPSTGSRGRVEAALRHCFRGRTALAGGRPAVARSGSTRHSR